MATNYNLASPDVTAAYTTANAISGHGVQSVVSNIVDLRGKAADDTFTLFAIPVGATVIACQWDVLEHPSNNTCTINIGYQTGTTTVGTDFASGVDVHGATVGTPTVATGAALVSADHNTAQGDIAGGTAKQYVGIELASQGAVLTAGKVQARFLVAFL